MFLNFRDMITYYLLFLQQVSKDSPFGCLGNMKTRHKRVTENEK